MVEQKINSTYYDLLGLTPAASVQEIRRAYRELSKLCHPDTTDLPAAIATAKFQDLNEAYATLSSPERRSAYDLKIGYSRVRVMQPSVEPSRSGSDGRRFRSSAYLDPSDRPLSAGEIFALFILGVTFVGCLILVIAVGMTRGDFALHLFDPGKVAATVQGDRTPIAIPPVLLEPPPAPVSLELPPLPEPAPKPTPPLESALEPTLSPEPPPSPEPAPESSTALPSLSLPLPVQPLAPENQSAIINLPPENPILPTR